MITQRLMFSTACFLMMLSLLFCGCEQMRLKEVPEEMRIIEEVVLQNPELAVKLTEEFEQKSQNYDELTRMRFELLKIRVRDKSITPQNSNEPAKKLVGYFENHGTSNDKMTACYYLGSYYRDNARPDSAIMWYKKAYALADTTAADFNYDIFSGIIHQIAGHFRHDYQEYLRWLHKINVSKETGVYAHYKALAWGYRALQNDSLATHYYNLCREKLEKDTINSIEKKHYINGMMGYFVGRKDTQNVIKLMPLFRQSYYETDDCIPELTLGEYYAFINKNDSAIHYMKKVVEKGTRDATIQGAYENLFRLYLEEGYEKEAIRCAEQSMRYRDSSLTQESYGRFLVANRLYDIETAEEMVKKAEKKAANYRMFLWLTIGVALGLTGMLVLRDLQKKHRAKSLLKRTIESYEEKLKRASMAYEILQEVQRKDVNGEGNGNATEGVLNRQKDNNCEVERISLLLLEKGDAGQPLSKDLWLELISVLERLYVDFQVKMKGLTKSSPHTDMQCLALTMLDIGGQAAATLLDMSRQNVQRIRNKYKQRLKELGVKETPELKDMLEAYLERRA